jgi:hypothetical protein
MFDTEEQTTRMPSTTEIAAAIAVRYVDECGKPVKSKATWGGILESVVKGMTFIAMCALLLWWGWVLVLPVLQTYTANLPTLNFGRIFGALMVLRSVRLAIYGGVVSPRYELRLVK